MKYDLIIFDCDGTLLDSEVVYNSCAIDMFAERGFPRYTLEYTFENWMGKALNDIIPFETAKNGIQISVTDFIDEFVARSPSYMKKYMREVDGALNAVRQLSAGYKTCVASNGEMPNILESLSIAGYGDVFDPARVFSKDQVARAKPAPDLFLYACEKMECEPSRAIVVEDSLSGIKAGRAAHIYTIAFTGISHDPHIRDKAMEAGADIVFSDWKDILLHINSGL